MSTRKHEMVRLLRECGEDLACDCGCSSSDPSGKSKEKKKEKDLDEGAVARVLSSLEEVRRKIGLRMFRRIKKVAGLRSGRGGKVRATSKMPSPVRRGPVHNRHR